MNYEKTNFEFYTKKFYFLRNEIENEITFQDLPG